ncbi:hypothetical protein ACROYT_G044005 [Oculina patagonica]
MAVELEELPPPDPKENNQKKKRPIACFLVVALGILCLVLLLLVILTFALRIHCPNCDLENGPQTPSPEEITKENNLVHFIHVSDINLDLKYNSSISRSDFCRFNEAAKPTEFGAPYGRIGCDTPVLLLNSSLEAMKNVSSGKNLEFVLISGNLSPHVVIPDKQRILQGIVATANNTHAFFPDIPVFPVLGLNDFLVPYILPNSSDWYETVLSYWAPLIVCDGCPVDVNEPTTMAVLKKTFLEGGYYNASIADGKMVLIVLNTIYWHYRSNRDDPKVNETALRQISWLENQLESAKEQGKKVLIASHIPPGMDIAEHEPFWLPIYTKQYLDLVAGKYRTVVAGQLFGHMHKDDFRLQLLDPVKDSSDIKKSFALLAPSLSPDYNSNPAFRMMSLDKETLSLVDYNQYYMDLDPVFSIPVWQTDYTFSKKYPSSNKFLNADRIDELNQELLNNRNDVIWKAYAFSRQVNFWPDYHPRAVLYCAMRYVFKQDYEKCLLKLHFSDFVTTKPT